MDAFAEVVDDMAALLPASVLQLLGGCRDAAVAWQALQASWGSSRQLAMQLMLGAQEQQLQQGTAGGLTLSESHELTAPCVKQDSGQTASRVH